MKAITLGGLRIRLSEETVLRPKPIVEMGSRRSEGSNMLDVTVQQLTTYEQLVS